ncbi:MAG: DUF2188 domain-containing protein [Bacilli bacterium]|nr:DUF2188 domain-containing protein [Bacilli bacterium]
MAKPAPKAKPAVAKKPATPAPKKAEPKKEEKKGPTAGASYHLSKRASDNKWQVFLTGSDKVIKTFATKAEAEEYTKKMAANTGRSILTHASKGASKGKIQKR